MSIAARLSRGFRVIGLACTALQEAMAKQGNIIKISTPEAAKEFFGSELKRYASVVRRAGVQPQ